MFLKYQVRNDRIKETAVSKDCFYNSLSNFKKWFSLVLWTRLNCPITRYAENLHNKHTLIFETPFHCSSGENANSDGLSTRKYTACGIACSVSPRVGTKWVEFSSVFGSTSKNWINNSYQLFHDEYHLPYDIMPGKWQAINWWLKPTAYSTFVQTENCRYLGSVHTNFRR